MCQEATGLQKKQQQTNERKKKQQNQQQQILCVAAGEWADRKTEMWISNKRVQRTYTTHYAFQVLRNTEHSIIGSLPESGDGLVVVFFFVCSVTDIYISYGLTRNDGRTYSRCCGWLETERNADERRVVEQAGLKSGINAVWVLCGSGFFGQRCYFYSGWMLNTGWSVAKTGILEGNAK